MRKKKEEIIEDDGSHEASIQLGELKVQGFQTPQQLADLLLQMLKVEEIKNYLEIFKKKKKINSATYTD